MTAKTTANTILSGAAISAPPVSSGPRRKRSGGNAAPRVLLVEDNPIDVAKIHEKLLEEGARHEITDAGSLAEAAQHLYTDAFDVVLLDLGLPDGEGLEVLSKVQRAALGTPIVVLTGHEDGDLARRCIESGADDFVEKGELDTPHFRRAIGYALARGRARDLRERLEHSDRLASIGRLAVSVAHEINNPITFVTMNQELLLRRLDALRVAASGAQGDAEAMRVTLAEMQEILLENVVGIERISAIVRDLRTLSRNESDELTLVDPVAVCKAACTIVGNHVRYHATLVTRFESISKVLADARKLEQVVINLVMNAAQSIEHGAASENEVRVATYERDGSVVIEVADTGSGMLPRVRERIFEPFFSTKKAGEGTGLGLSVSADIVSGFGGSIEVESENGKGSRFSVVLPRHAEEWRGPEKVATTRPPTALARKRVLLVDDEPQVLTALERSLRSVHDVTIAASGREAIALLEQDAQFDVVLCDLTMPDVDGVAVFADIQARFPHLAPRFVAVTGGAITDRAAAFTETSGTRVVSKPVSPDLLLLTIDAITREVVPT